MISVYGKVFHLGHLSSGMLDGFDGDPAAAAAAVEALRDPSTDDGQWAATAEDGDRLVLPDGAVWYCAGQGENP